MARELVDRSNRAWVGHDRCYYWRIPPGPFGAGFSFGYGARLLVLVLDALSREVEE